MGKISTAGVPSATFGTGPSTPRHKRCVTDKSVRRSAQDDDFGVSTKNILNKLALMGRCGEGFEWVHHQVTEHQGLCRGGNECWSSGAVGRVLISASRIPGFSASVNAR
jgi:hypothetical protein